MRYECKRSDMATKWYEINLLSIGQDFFSVAVSYGTKATTGEEMVAQELSSIFAGPYLDALDHLSTKIKEREELGYVKIEPKQD